MSSHIYETTNELDKKAGTRTRKARAFVRTDSVSIDQKMAANKSPTNTERNDNPNTDLNVVNFHGGWTAIILNKNDRI